LFDNVVVNDSNLIRLQGMKSHLHQRGFLSVRKYCKRQVTMIWIYYDELETASKDDKYISISHSHHFQPL
jgi:hypothetical protein